MRSTIGTLNWAGAGGPSTASRYLIVQFISSRQGTKLHSIALVNRKDFNCYPYFEAFTHEPTPDDKMASVMCCSIHWIIGV